MTLKLDSDFAQFIEVMERETMERALDNYVALCEADKRDLGSEMAPEEDSEITG